MQTLALAVFVKTPGLSPIKTRLAASIGTTNAEQFYILSVAALKSNIETLVAKDSKIAPIFAVAELDGLTNPLWHGWQTLYQGNGNLGQKLNRVYTELLVKFDSVMIIGSDSPQLSVRSLELAVQSLETNSYSSDHVLTIGPAKDGGFYLVGASRSLPESLWTNVRYSTEYAGQDLIENALKLGKVSRLVEEIDVDCVQDLSSLTVILQKEPAISVAQQVLLDWLHSQIALLSLNT